LSPLYSNSKRERALKAAPRNESTVSSSAVAVAVHIPL